MNFKEKVTKFAVNRPKTVVIFFLILTIALAIQLPKIQVDTDPENMLSEKQFVRVFNDQVKERFELYDMVVVGIVNDKDPNGVFNPDTLEKVYKITNKIKGIEGVIDSDIIAPSTQDNIEQGGLGVVNFNWLMDQPPKTRAEAEKIRDESMDNPILKGTMVSEDGKALAIYIPIESKDLSYEVASEVQSYIDRFENSADNYYISGLPVAEDTFGVQMFKQMAISAPLAMLIIFLLLWFFFKKISVIISPMIVAMISVITTMGLLIGLGFKVHIMSSMIPIFLMPIAVVDSVHILSEFYDRYQHIKDKRKTIIKVMDELFVPMLYTSLTTSVGFASLALTPIPPVQVFGIFVAVGVMMAWILTITFVPAYTMFIKEESLKNFGAADEGEGGILDNSLKFLGNMTYKRSKVILLITLLVITIAGYGITKIVVNDNPVKWFEADHPLREADRVLNEHFGGTYMAYMVWDSKDSAEGLKTAKDEILMEVDAIQEIYLEFNTQMNKIREVINNRYDKAIKAEEFNKKKLLQELKTYINQIKTKEQENLDWAIEDLSYALDDLEVKYQTFKQPEVLEYIAEVQKMLESTEDVGKTSSLPDVVKKVYKELREGKEEYYQIPDSAGGIGQSLISFQNSHNPNQLWHFVEPDYSSANIWVQLKKGDNQNMQKVVEKVDAWIAENPPPVGLEYNWAGLTYVNVVWQNKMVMGMLKSLLGSFVIVLIIMSILFRSPFWGLLSMIPLTVTVAFSYGMIGLVGKSYDMPVAVLSSLTLGLAVDFAIHFIERSRELYEELGSWKETIAKMFDEPARAITRNALVVAIGFLPLLFAPLVPYQTVGILLATILGVSSLATLFILPALITVLKKYLFKDR
ncbi:efflux RND transporter permease subunit [Orenia marismortui]|uniref:efflux RND transporter permease subunit n=1 Tax=Orenia marismortui TaxID=46469 RepID=UPI0003668B58|nr:efflux RND transporter permease subunit [Orenia marismortui]